MENQTQDNQGEVKKGTPWMWLAMGLAGAFIVFQVYNIGANGTTKTDTKLGDSGANANTNALVAAVLPDKGIVLPIKWGDLGKKMVDAGVIDGPQFEQLYTARGGMTDEMKQLLYGTGNGELEMTMDNSGYLLNLLWAFGLANKSPILENGPMQDSRYGGAGNFASTGGWSLAKGDAMDHYSKYPFITLTAAQQTIVENVAKGIYRPCCGNSTYFPDCNHGMAMLGLLELLAANGLTEQEIYKVALQVNSYWFPDTYLAIAQYFQKKGVDWADVDPKEALGNNYSSSSGYQRVLSEVEPLPAGGGGGGCGV